jgi:predicted O-linked N-acetylglucosamine transferase (SPINDLY family)
MQEEARAQLQDLVLKDPACARARYLLAVVRSSEGFAREAAELFQQALALEPDDVRALNGLGVALQQMGRIEEAASCYLEAVRIDPRYQDARINLAAVLKDHGRLAEAERQLAEALRLEPTALRLQYNYANVLHFQGRSLDAVAAYRQTLRLDPEHLDAQQNLLFALHYSPRFTDRQILAEHLKAARKRMFRPGSLPLCSRPAPPSGRRIRVGYLSPDFRSHAVARFIEPILAHHDRSRFEIFCYANLAQPDQTTQRLQGLAEQWRDIYNFSDEKAAGMIAADGIDILIDLAGHTSGNRLPLFARRPAPLQVTWIGYPDTTGLPQMDYRITDRLADPPGRERFYSERLIRLPRSFSCYQPLPDSPEVSPLPLDRTGRVTFGSFNNLAKVTPEVIALWGRVLQGVPGSRLLLKGRAFVEPQVCAQILEPFGSAGIEPERIEFDGGTSSPVAHLAQYHRVDIALDSFPYNGTTTTCEALWMGVPVITLAGTRHAARTGVSLLTNCGLASLVAENCEDYLSIARELAGDAGKLRELRRGLRERMQGSPLMDAAGITRELEAALVGIAELGAVLN